jgi:hypothetical protein
VTRNRARHPDLDIIRMRAEDEQIQRRVRHRATGLTAADLP